MGSAPWCSDPRTGRAQVNIKPRTSPLEAIASALLFLTGAMGVIAIGTFYVKIAWHIMHWVWSIS